MTVLSLSVPNRRSGVAFSQFLIYLVTLFNDGDKQRIIIFINDTVATHTGAVTGVANNPGGIKWCRVFTQFFNLCGKYSDNFWRTFDEFVERFFRLASELDFTHFSCALATFRSPGC